MSNQSLNEDDYKNILKNYFKKDVEYISMKMLSAQCDGFMGAYFILEINYLDENDTKAARFFVKSIPADSYHTQLALKRNVYEKEKFFYNFLLKEYEKYGFDISFAPKFYYCKGDYLVMENLNESEYKLTDINDYNDFNQVKLVLKSVSLYHSASIMYEEKMSEKLGYTFRLGEKYPKLFEENFFNIGNAEFCTKIYNMTVKFLHFIITDNNDRYKPEFKDYCTADILLSGIRNKTNLRKTTSHGDLWYSNIFFQKKNEQEQEVKCKIVDYQVLRYSLPALDVTLFIYLNCNKEFRQRNMKKLLEYYYSTMSEILSQHGYSISLIFSREEFEESLKFVQTTALFQALCMGTAIFMSSERIQKLISVFTDANWYKNIFVIWKEEYFQNESYKKLILDITDDLYNSIFKNNI